MSNQSMPSSQTPPNATRYDVIVIGAGPAGYSSAIRCAQLGLKTACVDNWLDKNGQSGLGGFYLNSGCVANLALLESAKLYEMLNHKLENHGIHADNLQIDMTAMVARKDSIVENLREKIAEEFAFYRIDRIHARARLLAPKFVELIPVEVNDLEKQRTVLGEKITHTIIEGKHIILATGSSPVKLRSAAIDNEFIFDSMGALNMTSVPQKLAIIGAGVIGLEIAGIWNRLGAQTIVLEAQEEFLTLTDQQIAQEAYRIYSHQGIDIRLGTRMTSAKTVNGQVLVEYQSCSGYHQLEVDKLIIACGRKPNSENLAAPEANLLFDENGFTNVNTKCRTNLPDVYAIGDLTLQGPMLAHKGIEEGIYVAEQIAGIHSPINYNILPNVIYTDPEIAWVGQTEQALKASGEPIKIGTYPLGNTARAQTLGKAEGLVKIIAHADNDTILGVHIIAAHASEMIAEATLAMEFSASSEDLARTIHAHPTLSESLHEAAIAVKQKALHPKLQKKKDSGFANQDLLTTDD